MCLWNCAYTRHGVKSLKSPTDRGLGHVLIWRGSPGTRHQAFSSLFYHKAQHELVTTQPCYGTTYSHLTYFLNSKMFACCIHKFPVSSLKKSLYLKLFPLLLKLCYVSPKMPLVIFLEKTKGDTEMPRAFQSSLYHHCDSTMETLLLECACMCM